MRRFTPALPLAVLVSTLVVGASLHAEIKLPALLSDHAVLQRSPRTALWGTADPGEKVSATLGEITRETSTGPDGKWRIELDLSSAGAGPFDLTISGKNHCVIHDVVVGQVWVASGQSNMSFELQSSLGGAEDVAASANPQLREFAVKRVTAHQPSYEVEGKWIVASPATSGHFSAVGYFFGQALQRELHAPVGVIHSSWPGTPIEPWISQESLNSAPDLRAGGEKNQQFIEAFPAEKQRFVDAFHAWETQYRRTLPPPAEVAPFVEENAPTSDWEKVTLPARFDAIGLPGAGAVWLRRKVSLDAATIAARAPILLGAIPGFDTVYWKGAKCGATTPEAGSLTEARNYYVNYPAQVPGEGVLAIRVAVPTSGAALTTPLKWGNLPLDGDWLAKVETELPPLDAAARAAAPTPPPRPPSQCNWPAALYNAMIAPLTRYTIEGAIWYQGEANVNRAFQYRTALPLLIRDWRTHWGLGDFPFYLCQLPNFQVKTPTPVDNAWSEMREAQSQALALPNTGQAILLDLGESRDIHPRNKKDVGQRLAALALAGTYGKTVPFSGPVYASSKVEGDQIRLSFRPITGHLIAPKLPAQYVVSSLQNQTQPLVPHSPGSKLEGFAICGEDRQWTWADARIDGATVIVSSPKVPAPLAVRYAWAANPTCNLSDASGLPAAPFRTDDFPATTREVKWGSEVPSFARPVDSPQP